MVNTDSISIFAEGTFEEQIQELVNYIVRSRSEEERATVIRPFQEVLKSAEGQKPLDEDDERKRKIFSMLFSEIKGLGEGSEKEIEGFFNLIYSHLFALHNPESSELKEYLTTLLQIISSSPSENASTKYRILSNLFNAIPRSSPWRLHVYRTLLQIAASNDELDVLQLSPVRIDRWLGEWEVTSEEKGDFLRSVVAAYEKSGKQEIAYEFRISYVRSLPPSSPASQEAAIDIIAAALRLPSIPDFDRLFKLDAVIAAKNHELFSLLQVFLNDGLLEFKAWNDSHPGAIEKYNLDKNELERKIRLLALATLGFKNIDLDLPYSKVASTLQVEQSEVEKWVIDVIRVGLLSGKMSQTTKTLHVTRATPRAFEREQWEALEKRLVAWKAGLAGVLEVVIAAQKGSVTEAVTQETGVAPA